VDLQILNGATGSTANISAGVIRNEPEKSSEGVVNVLLSEEFKSDPDAACYSDRILTCTTKTRNEVAHMPQADAKSIRSLVPGSTFSADTTWYPCACGAEHNTPTCPFLPTSEPRQIITCWKCASLGVIGPCDEHGPEAL
jgi:hypothetical protein